MVSAAISKGDVASIQYFLGQKYVEAFAKLASSPQQRTVIVPAEFAGLTGLLEGLKALGGDLNRTGAAQTKGATPNASATPPPAQGPWSAP